MAKLYFNKIVEGEMLWTEVPSLWRAKTKKYIESQGYICNEDGSITEPTEETIE